MISVKTKTFWLNYLRPTFYYNDLRTIDLDALYSIGIRVIICDLDNTLIPHFAKFPLKSNFDFFKKVIAKNFKIYIVSNNNKKRVETYINKLSDKININGYNFSSLKPFKKKMKKFMNRNNINYAETVFIGDQLITDILVANRLKCKSILVNPVIDSIKKNKIGKLQRVFEKYIFNKITKENFFKEIIYSNAGEKSELL